MNSKTVIRQAILTCLLFILPLLGQAEETLPPIIPRLKTEPVIDGKIAPEEWKGALYLGKINEAGGGSDLPATEAWIGLHASSICLAIRCEEPYPEKIRTVTLGDEIKGSVWNDDSIEVFIDSGNTGKSIFQLIANTEGTIYDSQIVNLQQSPSGWNSEAVVRVNVGKTGWEMEINIPMQPMGHLLQRGEVISFNIGRSRFATGEAQRMSLAGGNFLFPKYFRPLLVEGPISSGGLSLISLRRGPFTSRTSGVWEFQILSGEADAAALDITFPSATSRPQPAPPEPGERFLTYPILVGAAGAMTTCVIRQGGQSLYDATYLLQDPTISDRVMPTQRPLFESLLEPRPGGLSRLGFICWPHELDSLRPLIKVIPFRAGMAYEQESTPYREYKRDHASLVVATKTLQDRPHLLELAKEWGVPWVIYLKNNEALAQGAPGLGRSGKTVWALDPRAVQAYLDNATLATDLAAANGSAIGWLFAGDEVWEIMHRTLLEALDRRESYPELEAVDHEIREKYGFGKYGLPESGTDTNPYRWIATYRWEIDQMLKMAREVRGMIKEKAPRLKFISWDSMTGHRPYAVGRWGEIFDVITAQIYPAQQKGRDQITFTTKFYADISGAEEIWPAPHFEHYARNFTPEETEEILSATFRGGATGLHLWAADYQNENIRKAGSSVSERIGAPDRWNVVRSVVDRLVHEPFRVRQPAADTAVFYSNTSYQGLGGPNTFGANNEPEWIHTLLGTTLHGSYRWVDDISVVRKPESLFSYKIVYIPYMPIADDAEYEALQAYVMQGGTLVVCDPNAFRHRSDGTERTSGAILPPLESLQAGKPRPITARVGGQSLGMQPGGPTYELDGSRLQSEDAAIVTGQYPDWAVALGDEAVGQGKVIYLGTNPLRPNVALEKAWVAFFGALQQHVGAVKDQDVWRFRFPKTPLLEEERPSGVCLTGNYFEWRQSEPLPVVNAVLAGSYRLSGVDTRGAEPDEQEIPFGKGRLTDRIKGAAAANEDPAKNYVLLCEAKKPWRITCRFDLPVTVGTVRIFYSGALPAGKFETSSDGKSWHVAGSWESASVSGDDVGVQAFSVSASAASYARLHFEPTGPRRLSLVEIELWGQPTP